MRIRKTKITIRDKISEFKYSLPELKTCIKDLKNFELRFAINSMYHRKWIKK